jgi:hypothetical protein
MVHEIDYICSLFPCLRICFDEEVCNTYVGGGQKCYMLYRILMLKVWSQDLSIIGKSFILTYYLERPLMG